MPIDALWGVAWMKGLRADPGDAEFERRRELGLAGPLRLHRPAAGAHLVAAPPSAALASCAALPACIPKAYRSGSPSLSVMQFLHGALDSVT